MESLSEGKTDLIWAAFVCGATSCECDQTSSKVSTFLFDQSKVWQHGFKGMVKLHATNPQCK